MSRAALLTCLALLLTGGSVAGLAAEAAPAENRTTFEDARGEERGGPDVSSVVVSNSDGGDVTFRVGIPSHPRLADDLRVRVWVDSDHDLATGLIPPGEAPTGWDYFLLWDRQTGLADPALFRCRSTTCTNDPRVAPQRSLRSSYASGATFTIDADELGRTRRFRFQVEAASGVARDPATGGLDLANARWDYAPERGRSWSYDVRLTPQLIVRTFSTAPATPRAGSELTVRLAAVRSDTGASISTGRVTCAAAVDGTRVRSRSQGFVGARATCVFAVPAQASGRILRGSITVRHRGQSLTRHFSRRVR